jgi:drug/metabolite transporter (DMT)-like permease
VKPAADAVLLFITVIWGVTFVVVKDALGYADPLSYLALRFAVAALAAVLVVRGRLLERGLWRSAAVLGVFLFAGYQLQTWGLVWTSPSRSAFLTGLSVVMVPFISVALFKRPLVIPAVVGAAVAIFGLYLLTDAGTSKGTLRGDLLTVGCAVAFAFHIALTERYAVRHAPFPLVAAQLILCAVAFAVSIPAGQLRVDWSSGFVGAVVLTGLLATTLAIGLQTWAQARTSAVRAALIYALEPVFASGYAALTGGEILGARELTGGGLIIFGVVVGELGASWTRKERRRTAGNAGKK